MGQQPVDLERALDALGPHHVASVRGPLSDFLRRLESDAEPGLLEQTILACTWALGAHRTDTRKADGSHYTHHVLEVTELLHESGGGTREGLVPAAILHDSLEDAPQFLAAKASSTEGTVHERAASALATTFGDRVRQLVQGVTNPDFKAQLKAKGLERGSPDYETARVQLYAAHFTEIFDADDLDIQALKLADFANSALNLDHFESRDPSYTRLVNKYRPASPSSATAGSTSAPRTSRSRGCTNGSTPG